jgi:hypothetical protein
VALEKRFLSLLDVLAQPDAKGSIMLRISSGLLVQVAALKQAREAALHVRLMACLGTPRVLYRRARMDAEPNHSRVYATPRKSELHTVAQLGLRLRC